MNEVWSKSFMWIGIAAVSLGLAITPAYGQQEAEGARIEFMDLTNMDINEILKALSSGTVPMTSKCRRDHAGERVPDEAVNGDDARSRYVVGRYRLGGYGHGCDQHQDHHHGDPERSYS